MSMRQILAQLFLRSQQGRDEHSIEDLDMEGRSETLTKSQKKNRAKKERRKKKKAQGIPCTPDSPPGIPSPQSSTDSTLYASALDDDLMDEGSATSSLWEDFSERSEQRECMETLGREGTLVTDDVFTQTSVWEAYILSETTEWDEPTVLEDDREVITEFDLKGELEESEGSHASSTFKIDPGYITQNANSSEDSAGGSATSSQWEELWERSEREYIQTLEREGTLVTDGMFAQISVGEAYTLSETVELDEPAVPEDNCGEPQEFKEWLEEVVIDFDMRAGIE